MIKQLVAYIIVAALLYFVGLNAHELLLDKNEIYLSFSLQKVYVFHVTFSLLVCIAFLFLSKVDKIFNQLGFIYLGVLAFKLVFFSMVFYNEVIDSKNLSKTESLSLIIPLFIFLSFEVFCLIRIMNKK